MGVIQPGLGAEPPVATNFLFFYKKNTHLSVVFSSQKDTRELRLPSDLNSPLLALLIDLRYSISTSGGLSRGEGSGLKLGTPQHSGAPQIYIFLKVFFDKKYFRF